MVRVHLGDVVFWLGIGMLAAGLFWRVSLRRAGGPSAPRAVAAVPMALMLSGVVLAIAGLVLTGAL